MSKAKLHSQIHLINKLGNEVVFLVYLSLIDRFEWFGTTGTVMNSSGRNGDGNVSKNERTTLDKI